MEHILDDRERFYSHVVQRLILERDARILIVGGCKFDRDIFYAAGFTNVTITGLDLGAKPEDIFPYKWQRENATALSFNDGSFEYVVAHACIHHASKPHQMLLEMYRVASKGLLAFESRDSVLMRVLAYFNLTQTYEHAAVYFNDSKSGGVDNTEIPNFVFRWTEREVQKTIQSYNPSYEHRYVYSYGSSAPCTPDLESNASFKKLIIFFLKPFYNFFVLIFKKQQNLFSFFVGKPDNYDDPFPWLTFNELQDKLVFNKDWGRQKYGKETEL